MSEPMARQVWDAQRYATEAGFVVDMGADLLDELQLTPVEAVLDLGCGEGSLTQQLVAKGAVETAIDSSSEQIALAQQRGLRAQVMDAADLSNENSFANAFDIVLAMQHFIGWPISMH